MFGKTRRIGILTAFILALFFVQLSASPVKVYPQAPTAAVDIDMKVVSSRTQEIIPKENTLPTPAATAPSYSETVNTMAESPLTNIYITADMVRSGTLLLMENGTADVTATADTIRYYVLENDLRIANTSQETIRNLKLEVPLMAALDSPYQEIIGEEFSLQPTKIEEEANGNRIGFFAFDDIAPGAETILVEKYVVKVDGSDWLQVANDMNLKNPQEYLEAGTKIESTAPQIIAVAAKIKDQVHSEDDLAITRAAFEFARTALTYNQAAPSANKGALAGLQAGTGVCEEYASLFVATNRAAGVPARVVNGYANDVTELAPDTNPTILQGRRHQWAEFYLEGKGWIPADPTLTNSVNPMFGELPAGHYVAQNYGDAPVKGSYRGGQPAIGFVDKVAQDALPADNTNRI